MKGKHRTAAIVLACVACSAPAQDVLPYVSFLSGNGQKLVGNPDKTYEVDIDSMLAVTWDRDALLASIAKTTGFTAPDDKVSQRIDVLKVGVDQILEAQEQEIAISGLTVQQVIAVKNNDTRTLSVLSKSISEARTKVSSIGIKALTAIKPLEFRDPTFYKELKPAFDIAVTEGDYQPMAQALATNLRATADELARRAREGNGVEVYMEAKVVDPAGRATRVHLDGYDSLALGNPTPFARFQTVVDERTQRDLMAAQNMTNFVNQFMNGSFQAQVRETMRDLRSGIDDLKKSLNLDSLKANLTDIVNKLAASEELGIVETRTEARSLLEFVEALDQTPTLSADSDMGKLMELTTILNTKSRKLMAGLRDFPSKLRSFSENFRMLAINKPELFNTEVATQIDASSNGFMTHLTYFNQVIRQFESVSHSLDLGVGVAEGAKDLTPKTFTYEASLDTKIELKNTGVARHPGDLLVVDVTVMSKEPNSEEKKVLARGRQSFRMETYGMYLETRGALLLVEPQSQIQRNVSYQPTVGLGYHWKYGMKNNRFWNHDLSLGLGFSVALLDFTDDQPIEIGLALSATFFRDMLWVGYGRNLQAKADYFYIGLNLSELFRFLRR